MAKTAAKQIRERLAEDVAGLRTHLESVRARLRTRRQMLAMLKSQLWSPLRKEMEKEMETAKNHLATLDFDEPNDIKTARTLTANIRVLKTLCRDDAIIAEIKELEFSQAQIEAKLKNFPGVRSA